jgi:hypothetical protein
LFRHLRDAGRGVSAGEVLREVDLAVIESH